MKVAAHRSRMLGAGFILLAASSATSVLGACAAGAEPTPPSLVGQWTPSDGTNLKVVGDTGVCKGFFYDSSTGKPLDIGGPMSCSLSSKMDSDGRYRLAVTQGPNSATYLVRFDTADHATVYTKSGTKLYGLERFLVIVR